MTDEELVRALKKMSIETGGIICLGCGHEHGCTVHGCAVLKEAAKRIRRAGKPEAERAMCSARTRLYMGLHIRIRGSLF